MLPGDKVAQLFLKWKDFVTELWQSERFVRAILAFLLPCVTAGLVVGFLLSGMMSAIEFARQHSAQIIAIFLLLWAFAGWMDHHKAEKLKRKQTEQAMREKANYVNRLEVAKNQNAAYIVQAKILYHVSPGLSALGIVPPTLLKDLFSPARTVPIMDGAANLNLYLMQTDIQTIDTDLVQQTLQTKADQSLMAGEFPGVPETYVFNGKAYSGFIVHAVRPSRSGSFLEVYTTLANDTYCRYVEDLALNGDALDLPVDRRDIFY